MVKDSIEMTRHYVYRYCAPTRGSFLTGRYPMRLSATRANLIPSTLLDGINTTYTYLPKHLKQKGCESTRPAALASSPACRAPDCMHPRDIVSARPSPPLTSIAVCRCDPSHWQVAQWALQVRHDASRTWLRLQPWLFDRR
jgi:hypothetical protein